MGRCGDRDKRLGGDSSAFSAFRHHGLETVVDTTQSAEFDARGHQVPDAVFEKIARNLQAEPSSIRDRMIKNFSVRELYNYDVIFLLGRTDNVAVVTIIHIHPVDPETPLYVHLRKLERIATLRSATGL